MTNPYKPLYRLTITEQKDDIILEEMNDQGEWVMLRMVEHIYFHTDAHDLHYSFNFTQPYPELD